MSKANEINEKQVYIEATTPPPKTSSCNIPAPQFIQQGWQCPKCGAILAPNQNYCPFCSPSEYGRTNWIGTGYGAMYYLQEVLKHENDTIEGKRIAISGYGNVGWGIMKKASQLGAKVTYFAGPDGYVHDPDGVITEEKLNFILEMRAKDPMHCKPYADKFGCEFVPGEKCWGVKDVDVYMPAAMQNDVKMESAEKIAASGVKYYIEVANMPTTNDALNYLRAQKHIIVAPSKAVNAGGVGVSALEMAQNSERLVWTAEEVDHQLHKMMENIHKVSAEAAAEYGLGYDLVAGANIAGFKKVAEAMMEQGCF